MPGVKDPRRALDHLPGEIRLGREGGLVGKARGLAAIRILVRSTRVNRPAIRPVSTSNPSTLHQSGPVSGARWGVGSAVREPSSASASAEGLPGSAW